MVLTRQHSSLSKLKYQVPIFSFFPRTLCYKTPGIILTHKKRVEMMGRKARARQHLLFVDLFQNEWVDSNFFFYLIVCLSMVVFYDLKTMNCDDNKVKNKNKKY